MYRIIRTLLFLIAFVGGGIAQAQSTASNYYKVQMTIERDGAIFGTPTFITQPGSSVIMANSEGGYSFKINVGSNDGLSDASIAMATELYFAVNDRWQLFGKPTVLVNLGKRAEVSYSDEKFGEVKIGYEVSDASSIALNTPTFGKNKCTESRFAEWKESIARPVSYIVQQTPGQLNCCSFCRGSTRCC